MITKSASEASLTDVERRLVDYVTRGELLDLAGGEPVDEAAMRSWDNSRTIKATVLRDILRGRLAPDPDPHGLRLRGARIAGQLDLENLTTKVVVEFFDCLLSEGLMVRDATLPFLGLSGCRLEHPTQPPLAADRLTAAALGLGGAVITADCKAGAVRLFDAHLGALDCTGATMRNNAGPALYAEGLQVDHDVVLSRQFEAIGTGELGAVMLAAAHLGGSLSCTDVAIRNDSGPALVADDLRVDQDVLLHGRFQAIGVGDAGAVRLSGAHLGGLLNCTNATMRNDTGPALLADRLQVDQDVLLRRFEAIGTSELGAVRLLDAHLGGLDCTGATMRNNAGPALAADQLQVDREVSLSGGFEAIGVGELGAVRLPAAHLGSDLDCTDAKACNGTGPALYADRLQVDQNVLLRRFEAIGVGEDGAIRLVGAHAHGQLDCTDAKMCNPTGPALAAHGLQVDQDVLLRDGFKAVSGGSGVTLDLRQARIGGVLEFAPARLEHTASPQALLDLDGLTYAGLPVGISAGDWLRVLREATPSYAPQPYQQLASAHRAAGQDGEVRRILIAQRQAQIDRGALTGWAERAWARLTGVTLGYGYQPWRALIGLVVVAAIAVALALTLGARGGVTRVDPKPPTATQCSAVERVGVGLDLGLPLIKTGVRDHCDTTTSTTGQVLTAAGWGLQLLAWGFATLFVAGFTGAVRKT